MYSIDDEMLTPPQVATRRSHVDSGKLPFTRPPTASFAAPMLIHQLIFYSAHPECPDTRTTDNNRRNGTPEPHFCLTT
jgi:hypothetical protein